MDPVSQTLAQQNSGSAGGQGFGEFFVKGMELGQNRRRINLAERKLEMEERGQQRDFAERDVLFPLEAKLRSLQNRALGAELVAKISQAEQVTQVDSSLPSIYQLGLEFARSPQGFSDPVLMEQAETLAMKYPKAFAPGTPGGDLLTNIRAAPMFKHKFQEVRKKLEEVQQAGFGGRAALDEKGGVKLELTTPDALDQARLSMEQARLEIAKQNALLRAEEIGLSKERMNASNMLRLQQLELSRERLERQADPRLKAQMQAGLDAIARDQMLFDSDEKIAKMEEFLKKFENSFGGQRQPQGQAPSGTAADPLGLFP